MSSIKKSSSIYSKNNDISVSELKKLYMSELSQLKISKQLNISLTKLRTLIKSYGWIRPTRYKNKGITKRQITELQKIGLSHKIIADKLGICPTTLRRLKKKFGLLEIDISKQQAAYKAKQVKQERILLGLKKEPKYQKNCLEKYVKDIQSLLAQGMSKRDIARRYHVCVATVYNLIYLYDLKAPVIKKLDRQEGAIEQLFKQGLSYPVISEKLNCSKATVYSKVKDLKLKRSTIKINSYLSRHEDIIRKMYMDGASGAEIANTLNVHKITIYNKIKQMKLSCLSKLAEYPSTFKGKDVELIKLRQSGMSLKQIAELFGVKPNTVFYRLKKLNKEGIYA